MEVSPARLRALGATLHDLAEDLGTATVARPPSDPVGEDGWACDDALRDLTSAWGGHLADLARRLSDTGERLVSAADGYRDADRRAARRWARARAR